MKQIIPLSEEQLNNVIRTFEPKGLFYHETRDGIFIAVDNTTGEAWTEEFNSYMRAQKYLLRY